MRQKTHAAAADCCGAKIRTFFYFLRRRTCLLPHADLQQILCPSEWAFMPHCFKSYLCAPKISQILFTHWKCIYVDKLSTRIVLLAEFGLELD